MQAVVCGKSAVGENASVRRNGSVVTVGSHLSDHDGTVNRSICQRTMFIRDRIGLETLDAIIKKKLEPCNLGWPDSERIEFSIIKRMGGVVAVYSGRGPYTLLRIDRLSAEAEDRFLLRDTVHTGVITVRLHIGYKSQNPGIDMRIERAMENLARGIESAVKDPDSL